MMRPFSGREVKMRRGKDEGTSGEMERDNLERITKE